MAAMTSTRDKAAVTGAYARKVLQYGETIERTVRAATQPARKHGASRRVAGEVLPEPVPQGGRLATELHEERSRCALVRLMR